MTNEEVIKVLSERFMNNSHRHKGITWDDVLRRLDSKKIETLKWMEGTQGEPDVFVIEDNRVVFIDSSKETPMNRRSFCYDETALDERKKNKPTGSALGEIKGRNLILLNESLYHYLQRFGEFDLKTSSWLETPASIRKLGGALFGDRRFDRVFIYHNGADSYYSSRGFRCILYVD